MRKKIINVKTLSSLIDKREDTDSSSVVKVEILIENKKIAKIASILDEDYDEVIDGRGYFLSPGFIDPQVHFREPGLEYKEDIESGSKAANKGGFTTVISMPNTSPTADNAEVVSFMYQKQKQVGLCRVLPTGSLSLGLKGEQLTDFKSLIRAGAVAITDDGKGVQRDEIFEQAMKEAFKLKIPVLDHSEDESLSAKGAIHKGAISEKYGVKGIDSMSEAVHVKRGCEMSEKTGAHYHVLHISTKESLEYVKDAKAKGLNVTCEVSPHHLLLCDEDIPLRADGGLDANWKMNPPLRSKEDKEACQQALKNGLIDAIATDHAPHSPDEKANEIHNAPFGIIGLETAFAVLYTHFVKTNHLSLDRLIALMTYGAAKLFNLPYGTLNPGESADLTLIDLDEEFEVDQEFFASKSKNSPFIGHKLFGRVKMTIFEGNVVYKDNE